jgi:transposase
MKRTEAEWEALVESLEKKIKVLEAALEKFLKPAKDSTNSGIPPSQDSKRKPYPKREKSLRKPGGQMGHTGHYHPLTDTPEEVVLLHPETCLYCNSTDLETLEECHPEVRQQVDVPPLKSHVREYRRGLSRCRHCGKKSPGSFPDTLRAPVQMGKSIASLVGYLKVQLHLSHEKITHLCDDLLGISVSQGSVQNALRQLSDSHESTYQALKESLKNASVVHSDETGNKAAGKKGYVWVFVSRLFCVFLSQASRGFQVIEDFFGEHFPQVWVSDRYNAQLKIDTLHQLCLAHLIRDCQYLIDSVQSQWGSQLKDLLQESIAFRNRQGNLFEPFSQHSFRAILGFEKRLSFLFDHPPPHKQERKLFKGLLGRQHQIFLFLRNPAVPPTNNDAERALRNGIVHRKVTGCFRTESGSHYHDIIASVIESAKRQGKPILQVLSQKQPLLLRT